MKSSEIKQIDLVGYLANNGVFPKRIKGSQAWFLSTFRSERTPSFKIDTNKNLWYDFGEGCGGTIIDFVMILNKCNFKEALSILSDKDFSFHQPRPKEKIRNIEPTYKILNVQALENYQLINYLKSRKINIEISKKYCQEIYYTFDNKKQYYGISFKNNSNGYEVRNRFFKGCLGKKDITTFYNNSDTVSLFESWSDFLSYLTLNNKADEDFIILNSTSMVKKIDIVIDKYQKIKLFFDNDLSGEKATKFLEKKVYKNKLLDCRKIYKNYNDLNEYLIKTDFKSNVLCQLCF